MDFKEEIIQLNNKLIEASEAYYNDEEIMSNYEYDQLYDKLVQLEKETGFILSNSVTQNVGVKILDGFQKSKHIEKMLSLSKTKSIGDIKDFLGEETGVLSWKLDGLTVVIEYRDGKLFKAVTRGDGIEGEDITEQARLFCNLPLEIDCKTDLILRGEALISYPEFERIKKNEGQDFKNPRNLASGTVKNLDLSVLKKRKVSFLAFTLVKSLNTFNSYFDQLEYLDSLGFSVVEHMRVEGNSIETFIQMFSKSAESYEFPVDGLVVYLDDLNLQKKLGSNSHHPNFAIAFKWQDEVYPTTVREIVWSKSRTGRLNPIAIFDPVEIDGTMVEKASLHNLSYIEDMKLNIGDEVEVFKANMIIPQIAKNNTQSLKDVNDVLPKACPVCGKEIKIINQNGSKFVHCSNPDCDKVLGELEHFTSLLKIKHISTKTFEKLIDNDILTCREDLFNLQDKKDKFIEIEGLGETLFNKLVKEINSIKVSEEEFIGSFGIPNVSSETAKAILSVFSFEDLPTLDVEKLTSVNGIGDVMAKNFVSYIKENWNEMKSLHDKVEIKEKKEQTSNVLEGKTFMITGKLNNFSNRKELVAMIESCGGKVGSSVNVNTDYLINNDINSSSSKNKKAKELNIPIISEEDFLNLLK